MKVSARNRLPGMVSKIELGLVNAAVTLEIAPGVEVVSVVPRDAVTRLGLTVGTHAYAVIKASSVMIGVED